MDTEAAYATLEQQRTNGIRHSTDADLQAGTIADLRGDQPCNRTIRVARWRVRQLRRRSGIAFNHVVDLADMKAVVNAVHIWQFFADFYDNDLRARGDGPVPEVGGTKLEISVGVHVAGFEDDDVRGLDKPTVIVRNLSQVARNVMANARIVLLSVVHTEVPVVPLKMLALRVRLKHSPRPCTNARADLYVPQFRLASGQGAVECIGLSQHGAVVHP